MISHEDERAFPVTMEDGSGHSMTNLGMTLRDYFAIKAMASSLMPVNGPQGSQWAGKDQLPRLAEFAYWVADAMLAERAK
jgi:hypothetical protein